MSAPGNDPLSPDAIAELAALYVLGSLGSEDAQRLEARLERGDNDVVSAVETAQRTIAELDIDTVVPVDPPSSDLRSRILTSVSEDDATQVGDVSTQVWRGWTSGHATPLADGLATLHDGDGDWEVTGVDGVIVKRLFVDNERKTITMLVKMAAGASYPPHRHAAPEECLVLAGDLHVAGEVLGPGDYQRAEADSIHGVQSTENGCTLFITSSQEDELFVA